MKKRFVTLCFAVALLCSSLTGCTIGNTEFVLDMNFVGRNHVFSINGDKCSKEEARLYLCNYQNIYGNTFGINLWEYDYSQMEEGSTLEDYVKDVALTELVNIMCMEQLAKKQEITLTKEETEKIEKATEEYYKSLSKEERGYIGIDKKKLKQYYEKYAVAQKLYQMLTQGINEEVSDDEARVVRIQQIFVKNIDTARVVQQKLNNKEKFGNLVSSYNEADASEKYLARGEYEKALEDVIFRLDNNEVSDMITAKDGYYFIKCLNKFDKEMSEANKENIIIKRREEQFDDKFMDFVDTSLFELNEKTWEDIKLDTSGNIKTKSFFDIYKKYFTE